MILYIIFRTFSTMDFPMLCGMFDDFFPAEAISPVDSGYRNASKKWLNSMVYGTYTYNYIVLMDVHGVNSMVQWGWTYHNYSFPWAL